MNGFYWIYLGMLGFLLWYDRVREPSTKRLIYYGAGFFLIVLFVAQDDSVSIDIAEYMRQYAIIPGLSFEQMLSHKFELGYVLLCWLLDRLFVSDRVLLLVMSLLIVLPFLLSFERETEHPMVALMAYLALGMYLHGIIFWRQMAAMGILTFSYPYIRQRKLVPFLALVALAMLFHKVSIVFLGLYVVYNIPINRRLLILCAGLSLLLGIFGRPIIEFGIAFIYPRYTKIPRLNMGGETLLALFWVVVLLSYWAFRGQLQTGKVRLPFLMVLIAATIQPVCFAYYNWLRVVLFFRIALVPLSALLYQRLFCTIPGNPVLALVERRVPRWYPKAAAVYQSRWFPVFAQLVMFAVLFVWYVSELEGARYLMAPVVFKP